ncbi:bud site selection-related protein [Trichosporon asahii var. asahii CBS 2479]|uniref:Bud site selection-related protein n=1 Tax=Trichosporon asahii var. asahii (strain ATCC 90039 / CBS 2479 / JCM 2466 / KCTC 7840 / NBRC 103889/ NCYC 2677 / UAMH 7654) TaxID=1186058 RepID=J6F0G0_TRIAS|nr:bud site selection-related protein [Trichosporon asahii var. asahii CBS 2479]EJT50424.1 bud site selection-related protein [Trichosporon asahii var. asahii CBS 2479]
MGRLRRSRTHHARRDVQRGARTRARTKDLDQIERDLEHNLKKLKHQPIDEDKPGLGQHYCVECAKYYESDAALTTHTKSKVHKRRLKELREGAYTVEESERAAGLGTDNTQRGFEDVIRRFGDASVAQPQQQQAAEPGKMPQNNVVHHAPA